jgi:hypothetical protein
MVAALAVRNHVIHFRPEFLSVDLAKYGDLT